MLSHLTADRSSSDAVRESRQPRQSRGTCGGIPETLRWDLLQGAGIATILRRASNNNNNNNTLKRCGAVAFTFSSVFIQSVCVISVRLVPLFVVYGVDQLKLAAPELHSRWTWSRSRSRSTSYPLTV